MENSNPFPKGKTNKDISRTKGLFPMDPLKIIGGTISGISGKSTFKDFRSLQSKEYYNVVQEESRCTSGYIPEISNNKNNMHG